MSGPEPAEAIEPLLHDADWLLRRLGLEKEKTERWVHDQARAQRIPYTAAGRTRKWSEQNAQDIVRLLAVPARNKFKP